MTYDASCHAVSRRISLVKYQDKTISVTNNNKEGVFIHVTHFPVAPKFIRFLNGKDKSYYVVNMYKVQSATFEIGVILNKQRRKQRHEGKMGVLLCEMTMCAIIGGLLEEQYELWKKYTQKIPVIIS